MKYKFEIALGILAAIFLVLKFLNLNYVVGDENIYYKMAQLMAQGQTPYKDFFFSHPPLQLYLYTLLIKIFGINILLLKFMSSIAVVVTSIFIYLILKNIGKLEAIVASTIYLFSLDVLRFSDFANGIAICAMFGTIGLYFALRERVRISSVFLLLSCLTSFIGMIFAAGIGIYMLLRQKKWIEFGIVFAGLFLIANILLSIIYPNYFEQNITYHLQKPTEAVEKIPIITDLAAANILLLTGFICVLLTRRINAINMSGLIISVIFAIFFFVSKTVFNYYFLIVLPVIAIVSGYNLTKFISKFVKKQNNLNIVFAVLILTASIYSIIGFLNFEDQDFTNAEEIADYVSQNSMQEETIFGDDSVTGLVSILSNREITNNMIDTNNLRFRSELLDPQEVIEQIDKSNMRYFIGHKLDVGFGTFSYGLLYLDEFSNYVKTCQEEKVFDIPAGEYTRKIILYDCR